MDRVVARVGIDHAKALWALSEMGLEYVRTTIAEQRMPGVGPVAGWLKVSKVDKGDGMVADLELYGQELGAEIEGWPTERVRDGAAERPLFPCHAPAERLPHPSPQLCARPGGGGGGGGRAHLRGHAGARRSTS